jgi:hypothetical protein
VLEYLSQHDLGWRAAGQCQAISTRLLAAGKRQLQCYPHILRALYCLTTLQDPAMMRAISGLFNSDKMPSWQLQVTLLWCSNSHISCARML